jgi:hypothetical protein
MRRTTLLSTAPTAVVLQALAHLTGLPTWCTSIVVLTVLALAAGQVVVTQVIRLRASARITTATVALRVLEPSSAPPTSCSLISPPPFWALSTGRIRSVRPPTHHSPVSPPLWTLTSTTSRPIPPAGGRCWPLPVGSPTDWL